MDKLRSVLSQSPLSPGQASIGVLDGGQGTHLSTLGVDITSSLFGTSLLASSDPADFSIVKRLHRDYFSSGAKLVGTLTYQLADLACEKAGWSSDEIERQRAGMWDRGITGVGEARDEWVKEQGERVQGRPLVSLTLGPYGACLANGAECECYVYSRCPSPTISLPADDYGTSPSDTGEYSSLSYFDLVHFHKDRLLAAIASPAFSSTVDIIAFETIPRIDEADAILTALEEVLQEDRDGKLTGSALPPVYISFVFPPETEGRFLPYPSTGDRTGPKEIVALVRKRKAGVNWPIAGIGINCTKTNILKNALDLFAQGALEEPRQSEDEKLHLFMYPDGGLVWDAVNRCWLDPASGKQTNEPPSPVTWARDLYSLAVSTASTGAWAGVWVGGCCMTGPREIEELASLVAKS